jgi:hypothetical protein
MNIKELKEVIANLPDDMQLVKTGGDHGYIRNVSAYSDNAYWNEGERDLTECHWNTQKDADAALGKGYKLVHVLIID